MITYSLPPTCDKCGKTLSWIDSNPLSDKLRRCAYCIGEELREKLEKQLKEDNVNRPKHYTSHPSGIECIELTEHMCFNIGNAIKYCWRSGNKGIAPPVEDYKKAIWYLNREIALRKTYPEFKCIISPHQVVNATMINRVTDHMPYNIGQMLHYSWMSGVYPNWTEGIYSLEEAVKCIEREIQKLELVSTK